MSRKLNILIVDIPIMADATYLFNTHGNKFDLIINPKIGNYIKIILSRQDLFLKLKEIFIFQKNSTPTQNNRFFDLDCVSEDENNTLCSLNKVFIIKTTKLSQIKETAT